MPRNVAKKLSNNNHSDSTDEERLPLCEQTPPKAIVAKIIDEATSPTTTPTKGSPQKRKTTSLFEKQQQRVDSGEALNICEQFEEKLSEKEQQTEKPKTDSATQCRVEEATAACNVDQQSQPESINLYPFVIEAIDQCASSIPTLRLVPPVEQTIAAIIATTSATSSKAQSAAVSPRRRVKGGRGGKAAVGRGLNVKGSGAVDAVACEPHSRLLTLRARKTLQTNSNTSKNTDARVTAEATGDQALNEQSASKPQPPTATQSAAPERRYLDVAELNRIDPLEFEVRKPSNGKRKRNNSFVASLGTSLRRRPSTRKQNCYSVSGSKTETAVTGTYYDSQLEAAALAALTTPATVDGTLCGTPKKRARVMSLYERRYQNDDGGAGGGAGGRGVVSNGYLGTSRNATGTASAMGGTTAAMLQHGADGLDPPEQYYMSAAVPAATLPLPVGASSVSAALANGSSSGISHAATSSMATLCNIGNSCYLNSVVYTLRFAPQFLHNLHHLIVDLNAVQQCILRQRAKSSSLGRGGVMGGALQLESARSWSNKDLAALEQYNSAACGSSSGGNNLTQKSSHQLLTEKLHELYQSLHRNEITETTESHHADTLLHAIQDVSSIFEGNLQQDAHEFLMCVLNSVRETCQTLLKAIAECPDIIMNGYIASGVDEADGSGYALERDPTSSGGGAALGGGGGGTASNLSSGIQTKGTSFFSRKSKRKEETKNSKNLRLQSPLKDGSGASAALQQQQQQQSASNSLFYLNTVDLSTAPVASTKPAPHEEDVAAAVAVPASLKDTKERLAEKIRALGLDFFSEDFEGITVSTTKCLSCETVTEQKESMIDIAVPVPISGYDANSEYTERPGSFIQNSCITREYFRAENKYRCEQCTGYTEAIRSISYEVLPRLLVIQLSRFSGGMEKINSYIPTSFTLQCFCAKCCTLSDGNKLHVYKLYSVITHVGATMSVGHYIAYTCSLDWANEYVNCPKDRRSAQQQQQQQAAHQQHSGNGGALGLLQSNGQVAAASVAVAASALASSGTSLIKKMKFGRSKASSSGDMSKHLKQLNGINSKTITNGIGKLTMATAAATTIAANTTCHSMQCCATRLSSMQQQLQQQQHQSSHGSDLGDETSASSLPNGSASHNYSNSSGYGSTGRGGNGSAKHTYGTYHHSSNASSSASSLASTSFGNGSSGSGGGGNSSNDPIWYMCDDDKIKAMTQREFEDLLSPTRKITITPYLLFYARFDLQPAQAAAAPPPQSQSTPTKQAASSSTSPQPSWSSDSLRDSATVVAGSSAAVASKI